MTKPVLLRFRRRLLYKTFKWKRIARSHLRSGAPRLRASTIGSKVRARFRNVLPPFAITHIQPPALLVIMAGTTVSQYEEAGQLGRFAASLARHTRHFRTVILLTADSEDFTSKFATEKVLHLRSPLKAPSNRTSVLLTIIVKLRIVRSATSVLILDEQAAVAGWVCASVSKSRLSMSISAPWSPPRRANVMNRPHWLTRVALRRVKLLVKWPVEGSIPYGSESAYTPNAETVSLSSLVDSDLYCPITTTDPAKPRITGVFLDAARELDSRLVLAVAERLARHGIDVKLSVLIDGHGREARSSALNAEITGRKMPVGFQSLPAPEMLPDAIDQMGICLAFRNSESEQNILRAMSVGVPCIVSGDWTDRPTDSPSPGYAGFVLRSEVSEEQITRCIEVLLREPGIRLRMASEGRRFVLANHSIDALSSQESQLLLDIQHPAAPNETTKHELPEPGEEIQNGHHRDSNQAA